MEPYPRSPNKLNENFYGWHRATFDALLNYDKQFGEHGLKAMAGWHTEKYDYRENTSERKNFPTNDLTDMDAGDAATQKNGGYTRELAMISWFGRINWRIIWSELAALFISPLSLIPDA